MKKLNFFIVGAVALGSLSVGIAFAETFSSLVVNGPTTLNGVLTVNDSGFIVNRDDGTQTTIRLINPDKQSTFQFEDPNDDQIYILRSTEGPNGFFQFLDFSGDPAVPRTDISIKKSDGKIAIGKGNPTEELDLVGDFKLTGDILSDGDLCLGACQ